MKAVQVLECDLIELPALKLKPSGLFSIVSSERVGIYRTSTWELRQLLLAGPSQTFLRTLPRSGKGRVTRLDEFSATALFNFEERFLLSADWKSCIQGLEMVVSPGLFIKSKVRTVAPPSRSHLPVGWAECTSAVLRGHLMNIWSMNLQRRTISWDHRVALSMLFI